jgi:hypothetical protein
MGIERLHAQARNSSCAWQRTHTHTNTPLDISVGKTAVCFPMLLSITLPPFRGSRINPENEFFFFNFLSSLSRVGERRDVYRVFVGKRV